MGPERADPQERLVAAAGAFEARAGHEVTERVQDQIDEVLLVVDHQDPRALALGAESEGRLRDVLEPNVGAPCRDERADQ